MPQVLIRIKYYALWVSTQGALEKKRRFFITMSKEEEMC